MVPQVGKFRAINRVIQIKVYLEILLKSKIEVMKIPIQVLWPGKFGAMREHLKILWLCYNV